MTDPNELLSATDAQIDDAMQYASPMVLRGLLYQLTGDESGFAMPKGPSAKFGVGREMENEADAALLRAKGAAFLKAYRDSGAGPLDLGPQDPHAAKPVAHRRA